MCLDEGGFVENPYNTDCIHGYIGACPWGCDVNQDFDEEFNNDNTDSPKEKDVGSHE